ncbi:MAG: hypothetical protein HYY24_21675 [Verrucomicrobia bacterium]|nr:hypothetical protein [Verrucomicrobiota bacterium]
MNGHNTLSETPALPEQILAIVQDWQRLEWGSALDTSQIFSFDTTVKTWRDDCELQGWKQLGEALNKFFGTTFSNGDWRGVMKPEKQRTLRDVCALIATRATLPNVRELNVFGRPCRSASSFFALRSCLQVAGVETARLRPSTKLDEYLRRHGQTVVEMVTKLAPGKLPRMKTKSNLGHRLSGWACLMGLLTLVAGEISERPEWTVTGCLVSAFAFIAITLFSNLLPARVHLEGLETFGDLSRLIARAGQEASKK